MKKYALVFLLLLGTGVVLRCTAMNQLNWFFKDTLHVDEITYSHGDSPPFERPPGTYLLASISDNVDTMRAFFSLISLIPSLAFYFFREKSIRNSLAAGVLAVEPTLAFSGLQLLPSAPAAAFLSLALCAGNRSFLKGWLLGCAVIFRGELLLLIPVTFFFVRPFKNWVSLAGGTAAAVLPLMVLNLIAGGPFAPAENGPLNLWLGSSWELLETPPGMEYEQLVQGDSFTGKAFEAIFASPLRWGGMGLQKAAAFLSVPGPGRNIEAPVLLGTTVLRFLLPLTGAVIAFAVAGWRRNLASALFFTGILSAFLFFPSMRHRAVYIPALVLSASALRWKPALPAAAAVILFSLILKYPAGVRPGLTQVQVAQDLLEKGDFSGASAQLDRAEERGYYGADIHSIRGACIASSGGDFMSAAEEFSMALQIAPESPSAWKNMAALLWNYGYREEAFYAAEKAVSFNPALREELGPILSGQR